MGVDTDLLIVGRAVRRLREAQGLSQEALAELAGIHRNYVGFIERGERNPSLKMLIQIARALNSPVSLMLVDLP